MKLLFNMSKHISIYIIQIFLSLYILIINNNINLINVVFNCKIVNYLTLKVFISQMHDKDFVELYQNIKLITPDMFNQISVEHINDSEKVINFFSYITKNINNNIDLFKEVLHQNLEGHNLNFEIVEKSFKGIYNENVFFVLLLFVNILLLSLLKSKVKTFYRCLNFLIAIIISIVIFYILELNFHILTKKTALESISVFYNKIIYNMIINCIFIVIIDLIVYYFK
ncbi:hypothetical protein AB837_00020 [bacterium AB1]|nr:hypothetical protein AB837_00020 [bacterium AB1]